MVGAGTLTAVETKTNQETEFPTPWQRIWEEKLSATKPASPCPWEDVSNARGEANFLQVEPIHSQKRRRFNVTNSYIRGDSPRATTPRRFPPPLGQSRHGPSWGQTLQKSTETLNYWLIHHRAVLHNYRQVTAPLKYWWCKKKKKQKPLRIICKAGRDRNSDLDPKCR